VAQEQVVNAAAFIIKELRYLAFYPIWMRTYRDRFDSKWQLCAVTAQEVGHRLQGAYDHCRWVAPPEPEANKYAGFIRAALGPDGIRRRHCGSHLTNKDRPGTRRLRFDTSGLENLDRLGLTAQSGLSG
tara:strand:- start:961 stop:1347 length:387 start_codon:yes stop_codon:yes gene_type:complete